MESFKNTDSIEFKNRVELKWYTSDSYVFSYVGNIEFDVFTVTSYEKIVGISSRSFLPPGVCSDPIWDLKLPMLDVILNNYDTEIEVLKSKFGGHFENSSIYSALVKELRTDALTEYGYGYILNILPDNYDFNKLTLYLNLLNNLKGSTIGLKLAFVLANITAEIIQWYEQSPPGPRLTFRAILDLTNSNYFTLTQLKAFVNQYVYAKAFYSFSYSSDIVSIKLCGACCARLTYASSTTASLGS